ncbi:MAG TPA: hypothetical protein VF282_11055, partial [Bacillota bacterium]
PEQDARLRRVEDLVDKLDKRLFAMMAMRHQANIEPAEPNYMGYVVNDSLRILTALAHGADEATVHQPDGSAGQLSLAPLYARLAGGDVDEQAVATHLAPLIQSGVSMEQVVAAVRQVLREAAARVAA